MSSIREEKRLHQERKALNINGRLGSLYDAWADRVIIPSELNLQGEQGKSSAGSKCEIITGNSSVSRNILRDINIEDELRLSLLLNLTNSIGIAAILNDGYRMNNYTRLLYYTWTHREERASNETLKGLKWNQLLKNSAPATHVISGITYGIEIIVLLRISEDDRIVNDIERVLLRIRSALLNDTDIVSVITPVENQLLSANTKMAVYSNIAHLTGSQNIAACLGKIDGIKNNPQECSPISYSLSSLTVYCSEQMTKGIVYRVLPSEVRDHLEASILDKRFSFTNIKSLWDEQVDKSCVALLDGAIHGVGEFYRLTKRKYFDNLKQLSQLLTDVRHGRIESFPVREVLLDADRCVNEDLKELTERANDLKSKQSLIRHLSGNNISYRNTVDYDIDEDVDDRTIRTSYVWAWNPLKFFVLRIS